MHIHTYIDKTAAQGWTNRGSVITASSVGPILREISLAARQLQIHASVRRMPREDNKMDPYLSMAYKHVTLFPKEPPQEILQSAMSPGLPYSSSSGQANTAREELITPTTRSGSGMSNYSLYISPTTPQRHPMSFLPSQTLSDSC